MPTGYTAGIGEGISFEDFIMECAKAFGACITMRDAPKDKAIPTFEPSIYNKERLKEAKLKLGRLKGMVQEDTTKEARLEYEKTLRDAQEGIEKNMALKEKYRAMLSKIKAWTPPTPDHQGLKDFMVSQINESIDFDCGGAYPTEKLKTRTQSGEEWLAKELAQTYHDIEYHTKEQIEEEERVASRNKWVFALRDSL